MARTLFHAMQSALGTDLVCRHDAGGVSNALGYSVMSISDAPIILVVDDDEEIRTLVGDYLRDAGFETRTAPDGKAMRRELANESIDLLVLDLMLPGEDGLSLCRALRAESSIPIIMLTARSAVVDRIVGIEMGCDDYLIKPFDPRELLARIRGLLRRSGDRATPKQNTQGQRYRFAGWVLELRSHNLTDPDGQVVPLSGVEFRLLSVLLARPQRILSRNQLMQLTQRRDAEPLDRGIDIRISRLRQLLREDAREPTLIRTVYGEGYMLAVDVTTE
jgi:two-component system OmpR family response regulator